MIRKIKQLIRPESCEQEELALWLDLQGYVWIHVPNEVPMGKSSKPNFGWLAAMRKRGVKKGFLDNLIFGKRCFTRIIPLKIAIELKRIKGGRSSDEQIEWVKGLRECGWDAEVCEGAGCARAIITRLTESQRGKL